MAKPQLSTWVLILFITGAIDSIRNLPAMALFGSKLFFIYGLAVIGFLLPTALVAAELSIRRPAHCGVFGWCFQAMGPRAGLMAIWFQWMNTMIWYPSILAFIASTCAYLINPALSQHHGFMLAVILSVYWLLTGINCLGIQASARFAAWCTALGVLLPMGLLLIAGLLWWQQGLPIAHPMHWQHMLPEHFHWQWLPPLTAAVTTCLGMELIAVYAPKLDNPKKAIPRALLGSCPIIVFTTLMGALAVAIIVPSQQLSLVAGTLQAFYALEQVIRSHGLIQVLIAAILLGTTGSMINWMLSPAEGLRQASVEGLLPAWLQKDNRYHAPQRILLLQALLVSAFSLLYYFIRDFNTVYWYLTDLSTELYLLMYVMLFIVALKSRHLWSTDAMLSNRVLGWLCLVGILTCVLCLVAGFIPPSHFSHLDHAHYAFYFAGGLMLMCIPTLLPITRQQR